MLSNEFPDLTPSKIRFLEDQNLVTPARTASGYRKFSRADVERIRLVLKMQRDRYLPLKVIREYLAQLDAGKTPVMPGAPARSASMLPAKNLSRSEVVARTGASLTLVSEAVSAGLIPAADSFDADAVRTLQALAALHARGIEPRHLRAYRAAAQREAGLIQGAIAHSGVSAEQGIDAILDQLAVVRSALVRASMRQAARPQSPRS